MSELELEDRRRKWNQKQCSYCGHENTQFICWRCHQSDIEDLQKRLDTAEFKFNELIDFISNHLNCKEVLRHYKIKTEE